MAQTKENGTIEGVWEPDHYGNYRYAWSTSPARPELGLTGQFFDPISGTYKYKYRDLDPERGRWMSEEPLGLDGSNYYHFVFGGVIGRLDRNGLNAVGDFLRDYLPPFVGAPFGGVADAFTLEFDNTLRGFGIPDVSDLSVAQTGSSYKIVPKDVDNLIDDAYPETSIEMTEDSENGFHSWHCASNALIASKYGPVGATLMVPIGIVKEFLPGTIQQEFQLQGPLNWLWDTPTDIVANLVGLGTGLLLPPGLVNVRNQARRWGTRIPGPPDKFI